MAKNVSSSSKDIENWSRGLKDTSQKANFERDYMKLHSTCISIKIEAKGIGAIKVKIGGNWLKMANAVSQEYSSGSYL